MKLKDKLKNANRLSGDPDEPLLTEFLKRLTPIEKGRMGITLFENDTDHGFVTAFDVPKIRVKRETTPSLADNILCFDSPTTYYDVGIHKFSKNKWDIDSSTLMFCNEVMVDVDNFPLFGLSTNEEKVTAILREYPLLKEIMPSVIVDTGRKGFQCHWIFGYNMLRAKQRLPLQLILTTMLGGDTKVVGTLQKARLPYTRRADGNDPAIIYNDADNYSFYDFCGKVYSLVEKCVIDCEMQVRYADDESLFEDDIQAALKDYFIQVCGIKDYEKLFHLKWKEKNLKMDWKEQSVLAKAAWADYKKPEKKEKKKTGKKYDHPLSYFGARKKDLFALLKVTRGQLTGCRNEFLFALASNERFMHANVDDIDKVVFKANSMLSEPLEENEVNKILRSVKRHHYNIGGIKLGQKLPMSRLNDPLLPYYAKDKEKYEKKRMEEKKAKRRKSTMTKKMNFCNKFIVTATTETCVTHLAAKMGISRPTAYKYLKMFDEIIKGKRKGLEMVPEKIQEEIRLIALSKSFVPDTQLAVQLPSFIPATG